MDRAICHDCGVLEGELHIYGCDMEECLFCDGQLISCFCRYKILGLYDPESYGEKTAHLPPSVYSGGLSEEEEETWLWILSNEGRVPWIQYPNICAKCGELWPDMFDVPNREWKRYVQPSKRREMLCRKCYDFIKEVTDATDHRPAHIKAWAEGQVKCTKQ